METTSERDIAPAARSTDRAEQFQEKERSVFTGLLFGLLVLVPDLVAVIMANSVMLLSDLLKSGSETIATSFSWIAIRRVRQGRTFDYNYGQGKLENISSLAVAGAMLLSWLVISFSAIERFRHPAPIGSVYLALCVTGAALAINLWIWRKNRRLAQDDPSPIIESQWRLYRTKAIANVCVLTSLLLGSAFRGQTWALYLDPIGAVIVSGFLVLSAYRVITDSVYDLLDRTLDESLQLVILGELAAWFNDYVALHGIRSRRSGSNIYIEIYMEFEGDQRMAEVQALIDRMRTSLEEKIKGSQVLIAPTSKPVI